MNSRTRYVPALITLTAGFIACVSLIVNDYSTDEILLITAAVMSGFLLLGFVTRFIMDTYIFYKKPVEEEETDKESEEGTEDKKEKKENNKEEEKK